MRRFFGPILLVCVSCLFAQSEDPEILRAKGEIEKLRTLVEAGAAPRNQLDQAEDRLADAQDEAFLRKTMYGQDLTAEQSDQMIAAARRRLERRQKALDGAEKLVQAGAQPRLSLEAPQQDVDSARKEFEIAESRAKVIAELSEMAKAEEAFEAHLSSHESSEPHPVYQRYEGDGIFNPKIFSKVESAFTEKFGKSLPVSANGETAVHRALGFDHRGRIDVAVNPDQPEGVWLRDYLTENHIPFYAFRQAVPGKATGAHIHLGPGSTRLKLGG